jgi:hypothetical protein
LYFERVSIGTKLATIELWLVKEQEVLMKLSAILVTLMLSIPALGAAQLLHENLPILKPQMELTLQPLQTDLIRLYMRLPSHRRMIAGFSSAQKKQSHCSISNDEVSL